MVLWPIRACVLFELFYKAIDFSLLFWLQADMFDLFAHIVFQRNGKSKAQFY